MAPPVRRRTFIASAAALPVALYGPLRGPTMNAAPFAQRADVESGVHRRVDSINWYYELRGRGPTVVLIPSGEGDCGSFQKVATSLSTEFTVLTFDMPGFSRSSDPPDFANYSMSRAASEISALMDTLGLGPATVYGCSSGGHIALCMVAEHTALVTNVVVHEVAGMRRAAVPVAPLPIDFIASLAGKSDADIVTACEERFRNELNEIPGPWDGLGGAFHKRLERNYVTWVRRYIAPGRFRTFTAADLRRCPITWSVGALTPASRAVDNVIAARGADIDIALLPCRHFPQVTIPEALSQHIAGVARDDRNPAR